MTIIAVTDDIYVGDKDRCADGNTCLWPKSVPLVVEHTERIYVRAVTTNATVSFISENWAD